STIVNVALPSIQHDLHFTQAELTWVVNGYLIAYGSFLLVAGRVGDLIGRRKVFLSGVLLFTLASLASGLSQGGAELIAARFAQGLGGSLSAGVIIAMIVTEFEKPAERAQAMSVFTFVIAGGGTIGLLLGGAFTQWLNWHWIFFINVPIGLVTFLFGQWLIRENPGLGVGQGVDLAGAALITAALMVGVYAIVTAADSGWTSVHTLGFGTASLAMVAGFILLESRLSNPILPLRILRLRSLTGASLTRTLLFVGMFANFFMGTLYLQQVRGFSAFGAGVAFLPFSILLATFSAGITARLMARFGPRTLAIAGLIAIFSALLLLTGADPQSAYFPRIFVAFVLFGLGGGLAFMPLLNISMSEVPSADAGVASGFGNVTMQVGAAIGLAVLGTVASSRTNVLLGQGQSLADALTGGYHVAFEIAACSVMASLAVLLLVLRPSGRVGRVREVARFEREETVVEAA
ncbi:MAG: MFS transporter, partial [Candidatus Dormibacteraceae bacterium]